VKLDRWEILNIAFTLVVDVLLLLWLGWVGVAWLAASTFLGYGLHPAAAHFIHEHYVWKEGQESYSYYGPLNWVTFNVGYHNEHHDLMGIPCWRLPQVRRIAAEFYDGQVAHASWVGVLFRFITDPSLSHDARIIRSPETLRMRREKGWSKQAVA
jgi:sphingolipid delta-4 desaturase